MPEFGNKLRLFLINMGRLLSLLFLVLIFQQSFSQELIWENKIAISSYESLNSVIKTNEGNFLASGFSGRWKKYHLNITLDAAILMKFDEDGDTLWVKFTGYYGSIGKMVEAENGIIYSSLIYYDFAINDFRSGVLSFNENGTIFQLIPLTIGSEAFFYDIKFKDGYIWLSGEKSPSLFYPNAAFGYDFHLRKIRFDGSEVFSLVYNGNDPVSRGNKIEFMPNGNILFSGSVGNKIGAFEIDTAGNQVQYRSYFTNNFNGGWQNSLISQIADGNRIVGGSRSTNPGSYYLGKHDTSGTRIWGGISIGGAGVRMIFSDSTIVFHYGLASPPISQIRRLSSDSVVLSTLDFMGQGTLPYFKSIVDVYHDSDSSGVVVGNIFPITFNPTNLYIAKFAKLGILYNPTSAKAFEKLKTDAVPIPFPNPGTDIVKFTILSGPGKVTFTETNGRKVFDGEYLPEKGVSTKRFPPGIYNYKLERNGKTWGGKWVKE